MNRRRLLAICVAAAAGVSADALALSVIMRLELGQGAALTRQGIEFAIFFFLLFGWPLAMTVALPAVSLYEGARARGKTIPDLVAYAASALVGGATLALTWIGAWGSDSDGPVAAAISGAFGGLVVGSIYLRTRGTTATPGR